MKKRLGSMIALPMEKNLWYKLTALLLVLVLLVPVLAACDDDDDDDDNQTETVTSTKTAESTTPTPTETTPAPTPSDEGPIKLGVISSWSGAAAVVGVGFITPTLKVIEAQIEEMGGLLGREVEFVTFDDQSSVATAGAGVTKFADDDSISAVLVGGTSAASFQACADIAGDEQIPYFTSFTEFASDVNTSYTTGVYQNVHNTFRTIMDMIYATNAETIGFFGVLDYVTTDIAPIYAKEAEDHGLKVVYDDTFQFGTTDMSPYLTRIKHENPDALIIMPSKSPYPQNIFTQIGELGGWGDIKVYTPHSQTSAVAGMETAEGLVLWLGWTLTSPYPGAQAFTDAWVKVHGKEPSNEGAALMYWPMWTAIEAIELAGSADRDAINEAAHSGNLSWETPAGPMTVGTDGFGFVPGYFAQVQNGELVPIED